MNGAMNSAIVSRIVSSIPERTARCLSGTTFTVDGARSCSDPARLVSVARLLQWLSPLNPLTGDDQRALGLHVNAARPGVLEEGDETPEGPAVEEPLPL